MKIIFLLVMILSFKVMAAQRSCAVDGISDSPQNAICDFPGKSFILSCVDGKYYLGTEAVESTWHEEVEEGNSPLVFKTAASILKMTQQSRGIVYDAVFEEVSVINGICH
jgi:hypothetical protein